MVAEKNQIKMWPPIFRVAPCTSAVLCIFISNYLGSKQSIRKKKNTYSLILSLFMPYDMPFNMSLFMPYALKDDMIRQWIIHVTIIWFISHYRCVQARRWQGVGWPCHSYPRLGGRCHLQGQVLAHCQLLEYWLGWPWNFQDPEGRGWVRHWKLCSRGQTQGVNGVFV